MKQKSKLNTMVICYLQHPIRTCCKLSNLLCSVKVCLNCVIKMQKLIITKSKPSQQLGAVSPDPHI